MSQRRSKPKFEIIEVLEIEYTFHRNHSRIWVVMPPAFTGQTHVPKSAMRFATDYVRSLLILREGNYDKFNHQPAHPDTAMRSTLFKRLGIHFSNPNKLLYDGAEIYWHKMLTRNEFYIALRRV